MKHLNTFLNEGKKEKELGKKLSELIGSGLDPESFYEYLEEYSELDYEDNEYGYDEGDIETFVYAFDYIYDYKVSGDINTSKVKSSPLYKEYIKY